MCVPIVIIPMYQIFVNGYYNVVVEALPGDLN